MTTIRVCGWGTSGMVNMASRGGGSAWCDGGDERTGGAGGFEAGTAGFCPLSVVGVWGGVFSGPEGTIVLVAERAGGSGSDAAAPGIGGALGMAGDAFAAGDASSNGGERVTAERDWVEGDGTTIGSGPLWLPAGRVFLPFCSVTRAMVAEARGEVGNS